MVDPVAAFDLFRVVGHQKLMLYSRSITVQLMIAAIFIEFCGAKEVYDLRIR